MTLAPLVSALRYRFYLHDHYGREALGIERPAESIEDAIRKIGADLSVVAMKNWRRDEWFDETALGFTCALAVAPLMPGTVSFTTRSTVGGSSMPTGSRSSSCCRPRSCRSASSRSWCWR